MSVKQILTQTTVTAKWKLFFFQYGNLWKGHVIIPKGNRWFFRPPLPDDIQEKMTEQQESERSFMRGQSWNIIQQINTPLNPVPNKDCDKISIDISGYWICTYEKLILRSLMTEKVVSHPAYEGRRRWPDSQILWVRLSWNSTKVHM